MKQRITIFGDGGSIYSWLEELTDDFSGYRSGRYYQPFEDVAESALESLCQSDNCPWFMNDENIVKVAIQPPQRLYRATFVPKR